LRDASSGNPLANTPTALVPLRSVARFIDESAPITINHQDGELATTISFNLAEGATLLEAGRQIAQAEGRPGHADQRARRLRRHGAGGEPVARPADAADRGRDRRDSTSCSASCTRA